MAKFKEKNKAQELRKKGKSIKEIAKQLHVSKSTVSVWCQAIQLTKKQIFELNQKMLRGGYIGRLKGAAIQRKRYLQKVNNLTQEGKILIHKLSTYELLVAGAALYWGEGNKKDRIVGFSNSDPEVIKFIMSWFRKAWRLSEDRFYLRVGINKIHKKRDDEVKRYWSKVANIPLKQFRKTTFIKAKNKKIYKNFYTHFGTLTIRITKSSELQYKTLGLIEGLAKSHKSL